MTLVERFVEFYEWPTSRKSALLYGFALPFHIVGTLSSHATTSRLHWVDVELVDTVYWLWNAEIALCFLISLAVALRGYEGRWTLWLNVIPYGIFMVAAISLFGVTGTLFAIWFPSVIVLVTVWYSPRAGLFAFLYGLSLIAIYSALLFSGTLPYAPAVLDRSIDVQNSPIWTLHVFSLVVPYLVFCYVLLVVLISVQQSQQKRLNEALQKLDRSNRLIGRYVPSQLAEKIIRGEHSEAFLPERVKLTAFFSDVEGFTDTSDQLDAEDLATVLNEYLSAMALIAERYRATVSHFVGDSIMIFFGAPQATSDKDHALRAVRMALDMQQRMRELKDIWEMRGVRRPFRTRIGINTGHASVGDFGSEGRKAYSAIGAQINIAANIRAHCEPGRILISHATWGLVNDDIAAIDRGTLEMKGVHFPVRIYEVDPGATSGLAQEAASA